MHKLRFYLLLMVWAWAPAFGQRDLGSVEIVSLNKTIPVRVSANTPELDALAHKAFASHGRYRVEPAGAFLYDIRFALSAPRQVRVDVFNRTGQSVGSEIVPGTSARNALLRAADFAVEKTNGLGLKGFFASRLVFVSKMTGTAEIYEGDLFFGEVRRLTSHRAIALTPRWSSDGSKVIYTSYVHGAPDIYVIDLATNQLRTFASYKGTNTGAHYSPDGGRVAMVFSGTGSPEIWVGDAAGRHPVRLTHSESAKSSPCWSPDGSRIVFAQEPGPQLYLLPASGGAPAHLSTGLGTYCAEPDWSRANPNRIAFTYRDRASGQYQIGVYDFSRGAALQASEAPFDGVEPCWLADGRHLVYTARDASASRICILDTETHRSTPVSTATFGAAVQASARAP